MNSIRQTLKTTQTTQAELAEAVGISKPYLSQIINGRRDPGRAVMGKIARRLGCTVDELFFQDTHQPADRSN